MTTMDESELHATLTCTNGKYAGKTFHVQNNATIGRDGENSILLDEMVVSNQHARLYYDTRLDSFVIEDLGSRTGVMIDSEFVDERAPIRDGQVLTIANHFQFTFHAGLVRQGNSEIQSDSALDEIVPDAPSTKVPDTQTNNDVSPTSASLAEHETEVNPQNDDSEPKQSAVRTPSYFLEGSDTGEHQVIFTLTEGINLVGRDPANTIRLQDASVSRHHAVIVLKNRQLIVRDLDSKNHTFVDGVRVEHECEMQTGSIVLFGLIAFVVREKE